MSRPIGETVGALWMCTILTPLAAGDGKRTGQLDSQCSFLRKTPHARYFFFYCVFRGRFKLKVIYTYVCVPIHFPYFVDSDTYIVIAWEIFILIYRWIKVTKIPKLLLKNILCVQK